MGSPTEKANQSAKKNKYTERPTPPNAEPTTTLGNEGVSIVDREKMGKASKFNQCDRVGRQIQKFQMLEL